MKRIKKIEKYLCLFSVVAFVILLLSQVIIYYDILPISNSGSNNGISEEQSESYKSVGTIKLSFNVLENVKILVNGEEIIYTLDEKGNVCFPIANKDVVELDLRNINEEVIVFVKEVSKNIKYPKEGERFFLKESIKKLFICDIN